MIRPYPTELPPEAWRMLANAFRGEVPDTGAAVHVAYEALGYGLGLALPHDESVHAAATLSKDDAAKLCDEMASGAVRGFNWKSLLPLVLRLIQELMVD